MDDFRVEFYIDDGNLRNTKLSKLTGKEFEQWKKDMETRALSKYYNKKIKIKQKR